MTAMLITLAQVAERLGVSTTTVRRMVSRGDFVKPLVLSRRRIGFVESEVHAWIVSRERRQFSVTDAGRRQQTGAHA